jgi:dolichol-phosphate mannosyltransferase
VGSTADHTRDHLAPDHHPDRGPSHSDPIDLHVVVPVFNEGKNFAAFYKSLKAHVRTPHRLVVVYDFEEDDTLPIVRDLQRTDSTILLLKNKGKGVLGAITTGLRFPERGAVLVSMADLSDDHSRADEMFALFRQGCDVVAASRYSPGGRLVGGPFFKQGLSRLAGVSLNLLAGLPTRDPTNNYKLYSASFLRQIVIESAGGFEISLELTAKAHRLGLRIGEVPAVWTDRSAGESKFKLAKWLPQYLRWYLDVFKFRLEKALGRH